MSVMAARATRLEAGHDRAGGRSVLATVRRHRALILGFTLLFPVVFYLVLMGLLVARFGHLPNYVTPYDWFGNVARIIAGTGSISDMLKIAMDEWLLEIGFMNYAYGRGVSEWSLLIIPHKVAIVMAIGALIGLNFALIADQAPATSFLRQQLRSIRCGLLTSVGALGASLTASPSTGSSATPARPGSSASRSSASTSRAAFLIEPLGADAVAGRRGDPRPVGAADDLRKPRHRQRRREPKPIKEAAPC